MGWQAERISQGAANGGPNGGMTTTNGNGSFHTSWGSAPDTPAAQYGNSHPGGIGAILGDYENLGGANQWAQDSLNSGASYADSLARKAQNRGPSAREDSGLAWNEASGAGGNQGAALGLAGTLARGQQPSQAAYQLQSGLNANMAQQSAIARGARGGAALAVAGQNEAFNNATAQQNAFTQGGLLRSRDMATGRGLLGSQLDTMQRQNAARIGQADTLNQFNAAQNDKVELGMAGAAVNLGNAATNAGNQNLNIQKGKDAITDQQNTADQQAQVWEGKKRKGEVSAWNGQ